MTEYHIYVFIALLISIYLTIKNNPDNKFITFIIAFWILAGSVLNTEYFIIDIKSLPFDFQPTRIIFILFCIYLLITYITEHDKEQVNVKNAKFEIFLYLFIFLSIIVDTIHTLDILTLKDLILNATNILTFLVIYLVLKIKADGGMVKVFGKALLIVCTISSLIGIYQFLFDPLFCNVGFLREAFGRSYRSNGIFHAEYIQSYFLIPGIILALLTMHKSLLKYTLVSLFLLGIIVTFHRMSWIITIALIVFYHIEVKKRKVWQVISVVVCIGVALLYFSSMLSLNLNKFRRSSLVRERLLSDTMSGRMAFYGMVIKKIRQSWLIGFGSEKSKTYYYGMLEAGAPKSYAIGEKGGIHNGHLDVMFYRGIPVFLVYSLFLILAFHYFWNLSKYEHVLYFIPLSETIKFILSNMTNSFSLNSDIGILFAIITGCGIAVFQKNIDMSEVNVNE
jgi:hypothetical protein